MANYEVYISKPIPDRIILSMSPKEAIYLAQYIKNYSYDDFQSLRWGGNETVGPVTRALYSALAEADLLGDV